MPSRPDDKRPARNRPVRNRPVGRRYVAVLAAGAVLAGGLSACSGGGDDGKVRVGGVQRGDVAEVVEAPATVSARATAVSRAAAEGTIKHLYVADGDEVREGEVLATISAPEAEERLAQAREADRSASAGAGGLPTGLNQLVVPGGRVRGLRRGRRVLRCRPGAARGPPRSGGRAARGVTDSARDTVRS